MMTHCKQAPAIVLLFMLALTGCQGGDDAATASDPGRAAFSRYCAGCHGMQGQGRPPTFPPLAESEWLALPPDALTAIALLGLRGEIEVAGARYAGYMPPQPHIDDADLAAIVEWTRRRWSNRETSWTAADVAALRERVAGRGALEGRAGLEELLEELP